MTHSILKQPSNNDLFVGKTLSLSKQITEDDNVSFGKMSGDFNPLHFSEELAGKTRFKSRIIHGMHTASLFSGILAQLAPWCVYLEQLIRFTAPVRIGDTITVTSTIDGIDEKGTLTVLLTCQNQKGEVVLLGIAKMKKLKEMYAD